VSDNNQDVLKTVQGVTIGILLAVVIIIVIVVLYQRNQVSEAEELRRTFDEIAEQLDG